MINLSGKDLEESRNTVFNSTSSDWAVYSIDKTDSLKVAATGKDLEDFKDELIDDGKILFGIVRLQDRDTGLYKIVLVSFLGDGVPVSSKGKYHQYVSSLLSFFKGFHVHIQARSEEDVDPTQILQKVKDASGAKYKTQELDHEVPFNPRKSLPKDIDIKNQGLYYLLSFKVSSNVTKVQVVNPQKAVDDRQEIKKAEEDAYRKKQETEAREREDAKEKERLENERLERERTRRDKLEQERIEKERLERERMDKERLEREGIDKERLEKENELETATETVLDQKIMGEQLANLNLQESLQLDTTAAVTGVVAVALYDYQKDEDNEMDLHEGETITNVVDLGEGWYSGTNSSGLSGLFPGNYVQVSSSVPVAADGVEQNSMICAVALYDYVAAEENEISFSVGDKITGITYPSEDWWHGYVNGSGGLFPGNYVEKI